MSNVFRVNRSEINRLSRAIAAEEQTINAIFQRMGQIYFTSHREDAEDSQIEHIRGVQAALERAKGYQEQINLLKGIAICPSCKAEVSISAAFCSRCGTRMPVKAPPTPPAAPNALLCPSCGNLCSPGIRFCNRCGTRLETAPTAQAPEAAPPAPSVPDSQPPHPVAPPVPAAEPSEMPAPEPVLSPIPQPILPPELSDEAGPLAASPVLSLFSEPAAQMEGPSASPADEPSAIADVSDLHEPQERTSPEAPEAAPEASAPEAEAASPAPVPDAFTAELPVKRFCAHCGTPLGDDYRFCLECGTPV